MDSNPKTGVIIWKLSLSRYLVVVLTTKYLLGRQLCKIAKDCRYLTQLCDNLSKWMFLQNFFSWHYFGNFLCFSNKARYCLSIYYLSMFGPMAKLKWNCIIWQPELNRCHPDVAASFRPKTRVWHVLQFMILFTNVDQCLNGLDFLPIPKRAQYLLFTQWLTKKSSDISICSNA
jgi:hypothetical protein